MCTKVQLKSFKQGPTLTNPWTSLYKKVRDWDLNADTYYWFKLSVRSGNLKFLIFFALFEGHFLIFTYIHLPLFFSNLQSPFYQSCPCSYIVFQLQATLKQQSPDQIKQTKDKQQQQQRPQWFGSTKARSNRQDLSDCTVWPYRRRRAASAPRRSHEPIFQNEAFNVLPLCNLYVYCTTQWGQILYDLFF